jgi:MarR family transcriptional regulator, organic hydroperoxide resistance regulator
MSDPEAATELMWMLESIGKFVLATHDSWAKGVGITAPQWLILVAIKTMDDGPGVQVTKVAERTRVDPSFITAETKKLEKAGFVTRSSSPKDGRIVLLSLSDKALRGMAALEARQTALNNFIFADFLPAELTSLLEVCRRLERRLAKSQLVLAIDE